MFLIGLIFNKIHYHRVPPCPKCQSKKTGRFLYVANTHYANALAQNGIKYNFAELTQMVPSLASGGRNANSYLKDYMQFRLLYASLVGYFVNDADIYQTISSGGLFFILYSVVHVIRTNVITEYEHNTSETIQKEKNVIIVNIVAMLAMVLCFFIRNHVIDLFLIIVFGVCFVFYILLKVLGYFVGFIVNAVLWLVQAIFGYEVPKAEQTEEATTIIETILTEEEVEMIASNDSWILILGILILVIVTIFIVRKVYRALGSKESVEGTSEEKEFIFQSSDFLKPWKDKVKQMVAYGSLSKTRRKYIQTVNHCIKEGYQWKHSFTPNDYLRSVDRKTVVSKYNLEEVTKQYNEERYQ